MTGVLGRVAGMVVIVCMCEHNIYQNQKWRGISRSAAFLQVKLTVMELKYKLHWATTCFSRQSAKMHYL
jgi:hypothetical protein